MSETYTPQTNEQNSELIEDNFATINEWQAEDAARRAKESFVDTTSSPQDSQDKKTWSTGVKAGTVVALGVGLAGGLAIADTAQSPDFSETTAEYVVQPGDGLYDAAQDITNIESIDIREAVDHISVDPANIDVLSDGLQPGEIVVIPEAVDK